MDFIDWMGGRMRADHVSINLSQNPITTPFKFSWVKLSVNLEITTRNQIPSKQEGMDTLAA